MSTKPGNFNFNDSALWCSPNTQAWNPDERPRELIFSSDYCDDDPVTTEVPDCDQDEQILPDDGARITHPGSFQWFRLDQAGSFVFSTFDLDPDVDVKFDLYKSTDLSRPLAPIDKDVPFTSEGEVELEGLQYRLDSPPYYIRTFVTRDGVPDRTVGNVPYGFAAHMNLCRSPKDACVIEPNDRIRRHWPDQSSSTLSVADAWFKFRTSGVKDGVLFPGDSQQPDPPNFPVETFIQEVGLGVHGCFEPPVIEQYSTDGSFTLLDTKPWADISGGGPFDDEDGNGAPDGRYIADELPGEVFGELKFYYVHSQRTCAVEAYSFLEQQTTLTYFEPHKMVGHKQADDTALADDDILFLFNFDQGSGASPPCAGANCDYQYDFYLPEETNLDSAPLLQGYYVENFYPNIYEEESGALEILFYNRNGENLSWWQGGLPPLSPEIRNGEGAIIYRDAADPGVADYWYDLYFDQRRRKFVTLDP